MRTLSRSLIVSLVAVWALLTGQVVGATSPTQVPTLAIPPTATAPPVIVGLTVSPTIAPSTHLPSTATPSTHAPTTVAPSFTPSFAPSTVAPSTVAPSTLLPTMTPTTAPSMTTVPTTAPSSALPTPMPFLLATASPTGAPTVTPTIVPTGGPSTAAPSLSPSSAPTVGPTDTPTTQQPSASPTLPPVMTPTNAPVAEPILSPVTTAPTVGPTLVPSATPSLQPVVTAVLAPSVMPTVTQTLEPSLSTAEPTALTMSPSTQQPSTAAPSIASTDATVSPATEAPTTEASTTMPSLTLTVAPSAPPSEVPLASPTVGPSASPSPAPTHLLPLLWPATTAAPSFAPTVSPTVAPTFTSTSAPSSMPSSVAPTVNPTFTETAVPTVDPTVDPSITPSAAPSVEATVAPTGVPSMIPSAIPSAAPSVVETVEPTLAPSSSEVPVAASAAPSVAPSLEVTVEPSVAAALSEAPSAEVIVEVPPSTAVPSAVPSPVPSADPSAVPSVVPSTVPSTVPSEVPSTGPSEVPSAVPSTAVSETPSEVPSAAPSKVPTADPSVVPIAVPSEVPSTVPSEVPSVMLSIMPSEMSFNVSSTAPSEVPSAVPSERPSTVPSAMPSVAPSEVPSMSPSEVPSLLPSVIPSVVPSAVPSAAPSVVPSVVPSVPPPTEETGGATNAPSTVPSATPSVVPSAAPSAKPSTGPSEIPSLVPSGVPSVVLRTTSPVETFVEPSLTPTAVPSVLVSPVVTRVPTSPPSEASAVVPTVMPSVPPSKIVSVEGTVSPSIMPSRLSVTIPSEAPSIAPSNVLTAAPSLGPSLAPSAAPTVAPSKVVAPSQAPVVTRTSVPSVAPSLAPSVGPTKRADVASTMAPTVVPSVSATLAPSMAPTTSPSSPLVLYPTFLSPITAVTARSSVAVTVTVSGQGSVYCAALSPTAVISSVQDIRSVGTQYIASAEGTYTFTVAGLTPVTSYKLRCYTEDFAGHAMPLAVAEAFVVEFASLCCRAIEFSKTNPRIAQYAATSARAELPFTFLLDSKPTAALSVSAALTLVSCTERPLSANAVSDAVVLPATFQFTAVSTVLTGSLIVRGSTLGCYALVLSASGTDTYTAASTTFVLVSASTAPALPVLSKVALSDTGTALLFTFDSPTDRGAQRIPSYASTFSCGAIVEFPGSANSVCKWVNSTQLSASIASSGSQARRLLTAATQVQVEDSAVLLGNVVRAGCVTGTDCTAYAYIPATTLTVAAPANALKPTVSLSAPVTVSSCSDITLDPTLSDGFGGRDWVDVLWVVSGSAAALNTVAIATFLNGNFKDTLQVATIPNSLLTSSTATEDATYTVSLKLTNFLQQSAVSSVAVKVNSDSSPTIPTVVLSGVDTVAYRWKPLVIFASVTWPKCVSNATRALPIQYEWKLYQGSTLLPTAVSTSLDKRYFKLPAFTLDASSAFSVTVTASIITGGVTTSASATAALATGQSGVLATIAGAPVRTSSTLDTTIIDASLSQDIDYPPGQSSPAALTYTWSCVVFSPNFGDPCTGLTVSNTPTLTLPAVVLPAQVYTIGVTVANAAGRTSSASVQLTLVSSAVPGLVMSQVKAKYNPQDRIVVSASIVASTADVVSTWSSTSMLTALTPLTRTFQAGSSYVYELALARNSLVAGLTYTFQISARFANSQNSATSTVSILINAPPAGGELSVTPPTGTALTTTFSFLTSRWTDDPEDLPLVYVLAYYSVKASNQNILKASDEIPYKTAKLGQGLQEIGYAVTCIATAWDNLGSGASATALVTVSPPESTEAAVNATNAALSFALLDEDPNGLQVAVDGALAVVNSVDCTVPAACDSLNREMCSETAKTCGPCLDGYFGETGDSNSACFTNSRWLAALSEDTTPKSCPGSCNGQGSCVLTDLYENTVDSCTVSDPQCRARCKCDAGFHGRSCSLSSADFEQMLSLRENLCSSVFATMKLQDVSSDVVSARGLSISNILLDINQISDNALGNCTAALVQTVVGYPVLSCQGSSAALVAQALSNVLEKGRHLSEDLRVSVGTALTALATGCQDGLSVGEEPTVITTNNVNILSAVNDRHTLEEVNMTVTAPQTAFDAYNGIVPATVTVNMSGLALSDTVGVAVYQYTNNPNGQVSNASQLSVQTTVSGPSGAAPGVLLVLRNNEPIDYELFNTSSVMAVRCFQYESHEYVRNVTCGNGLVVNLTCPAYAKGTYNVTCPGRERVPQCKTFDGTQFVVNPLCSVVSFDSLSTTCYCAGSTLRRVLANGESEATQYGTAFVDIATNFGTTFASAPSLTDVTNNLVILSTLAGVVGMFVAGMFFFLRWDREDTNKYAAKELKESKKKRKVRIAFQFFNSIFPDELRAGSWYKIFMHQLRTEHFLIRLFTTSEQDKSLRTVYWAVAMGKFVAFLFMNCLVASVMYPDDGYCEGFHTAPACNDAKSVGGMFDSCHWRPENESCEFNPPNTDFTTSIIITLIVTMLTVPLEVLIEANVELWAQYFHYTELERKIAIDDTPAEGAQLRKYDEFTLSQGYRATLFRAARLEKARQLMDFISVEEEARMVSIYAKEIAVRDQKNIFASVIQQISLKKYRYSVDNLSHKAVCKRVEEVRSEAEMIQKEMEVMDSTEEQEKFLMRQFIVNSFATMQRGVVSKYFLKEYSLKRTESVKNLERASFVFLPLLMLFMLYYVYVFNLTIGSRATNMWLIVTFIGLAQDTFLIAPTKILINFLVINNNVSRDVRMICERLSVRSKLILMRTHGLMRDAGSLVQHFNPACRAARMYPALPISRLLMSLNDHDMPHPEIPHPTLLPWAYFSTGVVALLLLPEVLQETALDIASGAISNFGLIGFDGLRHISIIALIALVLGIVLLIFMVTFCCRSSVRELFTDGPKDFAIPTAFQMEDGSAKSGAGSPKHKAVGSPKHKPGSPSKTPQGEKHFFHIESSSEKGHLSHDNSVSVLYAAAQEDADGEVENYGSIWGMKKNTSSRSYHKEYQAPPRDFMDRQIADARHIKPQNTRPMVLSMPSTSFTLRDPGQAVPDLMLQSSTSSSMLDSPGLLVEDLSARGGIRPFDTPKTNQRGKLWDPLQGSPRHDNELRVSPMTNTSPANPFSFDGRSSHGRLEPLAHAGHMDGKHAHKHEHKNKSKNSNDNSSSSPPLNKANSVDGLDV